jgi:hypothetical protein
LGIVSRIRVNTKGNQFGFIHSEGREYYFPNEGGVALPTDAPLLKIVSFKPQVTNGRYRATNTKLAEPRFDEKGSLLGPYLFGYTTNSSTGAIRGTGHFTGYTFSFEQEGDVFPNNTPVLFSPLQASGPLPNVATHVSRAPQDSPYLVLYPPSSLRWVVSQHGPFYLGQHTSDWLQTQFGVDIDALAEEDTSCFPFCSPLREWEEAAAELKVSLEEIGLPTLITSWNRKHGRLLTPIFCPGTSYKDIRRFMNLCSQGTEEFRRQKKKQTTFLLTPAPPRCQPPDPLRRAE